MRRTFVLLGIAACSSPKAHRAPADGAKIAVVVPPDAAPIAAPTPDAVPAPPSDGEVYFFIEDEEVIARLRRDGRFEIGSQSAREIAIAPDGKAFTQHNGRVRIDGGPSVPFDRALGVPIDYAPLAGGQFWALGSDGVGRWDGATWAVTPLDAGDGRFEDLHVDGEGAIWVLGSRLILRDTVPVPTAPMTPPFRTLIAAPGGGVAVLGAGGVFRFDHDAWAPVELGPADDLDDAVFRPDGSLFGNGIDTMVVNVDGKVRTLATLEALGIPATVHFKPVADAVGRVWLGTDAGIVVLSASLDAVDRWWPPGSVPELGREASPRLAIGTPPLPEPGPVVGHLHGRVVHDGKPVAGVAIQICPEPEPEGSDQCADTESRADGSYDFWAVPDEERKIVVQRRGRWKIVEPDADGTLRL